MKISRRQLIKGTVMTMAVGGCLGETAWRQLGKHCLLIDAGPECSLQEAVKGYEVTLESLGIVPTKQSELSSPSELVVVPGVTALDSRLATRLASAVKVGSSLILECGFGFGAPHSYTYHRNLLRTEFDILIEQPIQVWSEIESHYRDPYVDYYWPNRMRVRDFCSISPLKPQRAEVIAMLGSAVVGIRKSLGKGSVIFLGSPLGPALLAGDLQARGWLRDVFASTCRNVSHRLREGHCHA